MQESILLLSTEEGKKWDQMSSDLDEALCAMLHANIAVRRFFGAAHDNARLDALTDRVSRAFLQIRKKLNAVARDALELQTPAARNAEALRSRAANIDVTILSTQMANAGLVSSRTAIMTAHRLMLAGGLRLLLERYYDEATAIRRSVRNLGEQMVEAVQHARGRAEWERVVSDCYAAIRTKCHEFNQFFHDTEQLLRIMPLYPCKLKPKGAYFSPVAVTSA